MKNSWLLALTFIVLISCKNKRTTLTDDDPTVSSEEFVDFFPEMRLPYSIADTILLKKNNDSALIGNKIFSQMVGDTVLKGVFGTRKPKLYVIGRVPVKKAETYLFVKAISPDKKAAYVLTFDKEQKFTASLPLMVVDNDPQTQQTAGMDSRYTINMNRQRRKTDGSTIYRKDSYAYNNAGVYILLVTESNEDVAATSDVVNPLDTFSVKHKHSGDYIKDKRNMIAIRDGRNGQSMRFFVHFEKDKGTCRGELRGEAVFTQPNIAIYRESGDPCVLQFSFTANSVSMKELEGCGNYRDIKCFFEGSFPRKKEPKPRRK